MKLKKKLVKILVCMSGGVDSSVAAALLIKAGYDVTGMFAVNYDNQNEKKPCLQGVANQNEKKSCLQGVANQNEKKPCWRGDYQDALRVAAKLRIPLLRLNFVKEYKKTVLDYMYSEYKKGRTPNPDVLCNKFVKFGFWLKKAKELGFDKLATGHYAKLSRKSIKSIKSVKSSDLSSLRIRQLAEGSRIELVQAIDDNKDQTYFLHQLNQSQLKHVLFPIGEYTKEQVRKLAEKFGLATAKKEESMGICFIGEVPMKEFLQKKIKVKKGKIISNESKEIIGEHDGISFYTIGERIGINSKPYFVVKKDVKKNILYVGGENDPELFKKEIVVEDINWISGQKPKLPLKCEVRLRHRQTLQKCSVEFIKSIKFIKSKVANSVVVKFDNPQRAVTPGQFAVFYVPSRSSKGAKDGLKGQCLGGGTIKN